MRTALRAAAVAAALAAASPAHASMVLNEIVVNPPGADDAREYVEVRATDPADSFAGVWLIELEGDATGPGVVENAVDLSAVVPAASGIVLLGHNYATSTPWPDVPASTARVNLARRGSFAMENGSTTFLLVRNFSGAFGDDLDVDDDGVLDGAPWSEVLDTVGWGDVAAGGRVYSSAVVLLAGGVVDAVTRFPDDVRPSSGPAWYGGDLAPSGATPDLSTSYDAAHVTPSFPAPPAYDGVGALTPGVANVPHPFAVGACGDGTTDPGEECDDGNLLDGDCCSSACAIEPAGTVCRAAAGECDVAEECDGASPQCPDDALADSSVVCRDVAASCDVAERCDGASAACPDDAFAGSDVVCREAVGACDVAESCTGDVAECPRDALAPDDTACDDADPCTHADHCDAGTCGGTLDPLCGATPLLCRKAAPAKAPRGAPRYPRFVGRTGDLLIDAVSLVEVGGGRRLDLQKPVAVCADAPALPAVGLEALRVKLTKTTPKQPKPAKTVHTIENQLGTLRVRVDGVDRALVPASLASGAGGAPPLASGGTGAFACYRVSVAREPGNAFDGARLTVPDALGVDRVVDLVKPTLLCAPADVNGADPGAPARALHLACYAAKLAKLAPRQAKLAKARASLATAFGAEVLDAGALAEVCLPSLRHG